MFAVQVFGILPVFLENLLESENVFCCATTRTKTALGWLFSSFGSIISWHLFSRHLAHTFSVGLRRDMPQQSVHSLLSPFLRMEMNTLVFQSFSAFPEHQATWSKPPDLDTYRWSRHISWCNSKANLYLELISFVGKVSFTCKLFSFSKVIKITVDLQ